MKIVDLLNLLDHKTEIMLTYLKKKQKLSLFIFILIIFLAFFLRVYNLETFPAWYIDEGAWSMLGKNILQGHFWQSPQATMSKYPLFAFLVGISLSFRSTMFNARLVPVMMGIASTVVIYMLGRKIYNRSSGVLAALFHSINPFAIYYERSVFLDVGLAFFLPLSLLLLYWYLEKPNNSRMILAALCVGLGIMCKISGVIMLIAAAVILLAYKRSKKEILTFEFYAALIPIAWYSFILILDPTDFAKEYMIRLHANRAFGTSPGTFFSGFIFSLKTSSELGANFILFGMISVVYLLKKLDRRHVFILAPFLAEMSFFAILMTLPNFYLISIVGLLSLASGKFVTDIIKGKDLVRILGLLLLGFSLFIPLQSSSPGTLGLVSLQVLFLILPLLILKILKNVCNIPNGGLSSLSVILALILVATVSIAVVHNDYRIISTDGRHFSTFGESSLDQKSVVNYLNSHTTVADIVYAESVIVFQLKCDARDNAFVDNVTVHEAKFVVIDPFWKHFDENPFYGIDIGTPRDWVENNWNSVITFGQYAIYLNPNRAYMPYCHSNIVET